jgi:uncharacterized repeat protein (TIGR03837 family)
MDMRWDIFCRVVDNFGDIGTCWRLARQLAAEHQADVRLWVDDLGTFSRLCPEVSVDLDSQRVGLIEVRHWRSEFPSVEAADVVIEAFACELPPSYVAAMTLRAVAPVWINLEYLSAEEWVEECHLLTSPNSKSTLKKYFFFPGFTPQTGGLLQERDLLTRRTAFTAAAAEKFWRGLEIPPRTDGELRVSMFCYDNAALPPLLQSWANGSEPVRLLAAPGAATQQIARCFEESLTAGTSLRRNSLTVHALPFLPQASYDLLLWACDVNFVRGEDSFVRAQWAQRPFVWQIYPQQELAHLKKLDAFLGRYLENFQDSEVVSRLWRVWNGAANSGTAWQDFIAKRRSIQQHTEVWVFQLDRAGNLANNLSRFVHEK